MMEVSKQFISKIILSNLQYKNSNFIYNKNKFVNEYEFDINNIPLDIDICGIHEYYDTNNDILNIPKNIFVKISKFCKHNNILVKCYIYGNHNIGVYCTIRKLKKHYFKELLRLKTYLNKFDISINFINYD